MEHPSPRDHTDNQILSQMRGMKNIVMTTRESKIRPVGCVILTTSGCRVSQNGTRAKERSLSTETIQRDGAYVDEVAGLTNGSR